MRTCGLFRRAVLDDKVRPGPSLLLATALSEARLVSDPAGNEKLAKRGEGGRRTRARDDSLAAAILAVAEGISAVELLSVAGITGAWPREYSS